MKVRGAASSVAFCALIACRSGGSGTPDPPDVLASPQASVVPAPMANAPTATTSASAVMPTDGAPPPQPMRADQSIGADVLPMKEIAGYSIQATLHADDAPAVAKGPEHSFAAMESARKKTDPRLAIDFGLGRARIQLQGPGFVLPEGTELRARSDRYGHLVFPADLAGYRIAAPGTLRALFDERRFDVAPMSAGEVIQTGEGSRRLGYRTRKVQVVNRAARATFEIARVVDAGESGTLLCRVLLDWMNAPPQTPLCGIDDVPMFAEFDWTTRGTVTFNATSILRRLDLAAGVLATPPPTAAFGTNAFAPLASAVLLSRNELHALRTGDHPPEEKPSLVLVNPGDILRYAWVDGVPIAWLAPGARLEVPSLAKGRATIEWRSFFGDVIEPSRTITLPAVSTVGTGEADAGL